MRRRLPEPKRSAHAASIAARTWRTMVSNIDSSGSEVKASDRATTPTGRGHAGEPGIGGLAAVQPQDLGAATADVDQQGRLGAGLDQGQTSEQRQVRLLLVRQDLELDPGRPAHPGQELGPVERAAAGLGRDAAGLAHAVAGHDPGAHPERRDRARHRPFLEPAACREPFAEAHDPREAVDHLEAVGMRSRDQQTAVIGPQIEGSQRRHPRVSPYWTVSIGPLTLRGAAVVGQGFPGALAEPEGLG